MSTTIEACNCTEWTGGDALRQCPSHYAIHRGNKRLTSVSRVLSVWPQEPCSNCGMPIYSDRHVNCPVQAAIENANARGREVDALFCAYVTGNLKRIPAGTRIDSRDLFLKLKAWFDRQNFNSVHAQVLVADDEIGGVLDLKLDNCILDLKTVYNISPTHAIQVGGYAALDSGIPDRAGILHVTERYSEPRVMWLDMNEILEDWETCRAMHALVKRRTA